MDSSTSRMRRPQPLDPNSRTPRVDAAERFFYSQSKQPVGFVLSDLAKQLETELAEAVELLQRNGIELPKSQDVDAGEGAASEPVARSPAEPTRSRLAAATASQAPAPAAAPVARPAALKPSKAPINAGETIEYEDGQVLFNKGDQAKHLAIILEGSVEVFDPVDNKVLATLGVGASFGEMAILEGGVRGASVRAAGKIKCIEIRTEPLRAILKADTGLLVPTMEGLLLQQSMANNLSRLLKQGSDGALGYEIMGDQNMNSVQLQRKLNEAYANPDTHGLNAEQLMYLKLQATARLPTSLYRAGRTLCSPQQEHEGDAFVLVEGAVEATLGGRSVRLGHGSILGLAEGITGAPYAWTSIALEDVTVKTIPMDKVLRDLERANSGIAGIVRYTTSRILELQTALAG